MKRSFPTSPGFRATHRWRHRAASLVLFLFGFLSIDVLPAQTTRQLREAEKLARSGSYIKATEQAVKDVEERPYSERNWRFLIDLQVEQGRYRDARESLDNALQRFPSSIVLRWKASKLLPFVGDRERGRALLLEIGELARRSPWRYGDPESRITLGRFFLKQGADARQVLNVFFDPVKKSNPDYVNTYLASGELALQKHDYAIAAREFEQAAKIEPDSWPAFFGLGRAFESSDTSRAEAAFERVMQINPRSVPMLLHQVDRTLDAEQYERCRVLLKVVHSIHPAHPRARALDAVLALLENDPKAAADSRSTGLSQWEENPEVDYWIGKKLSDKYRFAEGAAYQQAALSLDPDYGPSRFQLAQDLLRIGREEEGWALAEAVAKDDQYNVVAHNLSLLKKQIDAFTELRRPGLLVRMDQREAKIYGEQVLELLERARTVLKKKYDTELPDPVIVELYPDQPDFAIRTFGVPGGAGFLGVCFGPLITANSPASQRETPANWQSVLWHEFCHVVTLSKTRNRMPRWLSEGISVHEELQEDRTWGQSMTAVYREMILGEDLTPVSQLSGAFLRPASPIHLQFAYYESALAVRFLVDRWGMDALRSVLNDLASGLPINDALARHTIPVEQLDREFATYASGLARQYAPDADWERPKAAGAFASSPEGEKPIVEIPSALPDAGQWLEDHPNSVWAIRRLLDTAVRTGHWTDVEKWAGRLDQLVPDQEGPQSPARLLARSYEERRRTDQEIDVLQRISRRTADDLDCLLRLIELGQEQQNWTLVLDATRRILPINPLLVSVHQARIEAATEINESQDLQGSLIALIEMDPIDPAGLHFQLAQSLHRSGDLVPARRHVLQALEFAPRYRDALGLLARLHAEAPAQSDDASVRIKQQGPDPPPLPESASGSSAKPSGGQP